VGSGARARRPRARTAWDQSARPGSDPAWAKGHLASGTRSLIATVVEVLALLLLLAGVLAAATGGGSALLGLAAAVVLVAVPTVFVIGGRS
jgi:hypothetical protein